MPETNLELNECLPGWQSPNFPQRCREILLESDMYTKMIREKTLIIKIRLIKHTKFGIFWSSCSMES